MRQIELFGIENPCVSICEMNRQGYCIGCLRNRRERQAWHTLSDSDKQHILVLLIRRRARLHKRLTVLPMHTVLPSQLDLLHNDETAEDPVDST